MCAWLRFLGVSSNCTVVLVLCLISSYLRSCVSNVDLGGTVLLYVTLISLPFLLTGVQNPGFGRVHTILLNPGYCWVHTIPLNPDLSRVHNLLLGCDLWFTQPHVHTNFFIVVSILDCPCCWHILYSCHYTHRFWGCLCGYWVPFLAMSLYDCW